MLVIAQKFSKRKLRQVRPTDLVNHFFSHFKSCILPFSKETDKPRIFDKVFASFKILLHDSN